MHVDLASSPQHGATLRALQANRKERRFNFFNNVRKCRRREQGDAWLTAPVARLFSTEDQYHLLLEEAIRRRIVAALHRQSRTASQVARRAHTV